MSFKMTDDRNRATKETSKRKTAKVRKIRDYAAYKLTRHDRVEEIKAVWDSHSFKTNNQRLVYLFRHCHNIEYGYTIREFAHARFPDRMTGPDVESNGKYFAFQALHMMFNRFRHDELNHEVLLASLYKKLDKDTVGRWYYYNIIDDEEAIKEVQLRSERCILGLERRKQDLMGIAEMSEEDWNTLQDRRVKELQAKAGKKKKSKK